MPIDLPRSARLASPGFDGLSRWLVAVAGALALATGVLVPGVGWALGALLVLAGWLLSRRRRTIGAYEGVDGIVVRNWFATRLLPWSGLERVEERRDPWLPVFRVASVRDRAGRSLPVSGLRHLSSATPAPVLTLTKLVRDRRDERSREPWKF